MDWNDFAKRLTLELSRLPVTSFLIVQGPSGLPYAQAMRAEGLLDAETVGSAFLPRPLAPRQERRLRSLGWEPPDGEERKNWWNQYTLRERGSKARVEHLEACALVAGLMVGSFRDVYGIESPLELVYQASRTGPEGGPLTLPGLGIPLAVPEDENRRGSARPRPSGPSLETALTEARDRGDQQGYLELLARAVLYLPAPPGAPGEHRFATARFGDGTYVLAFTSPEAMDRSLQGQAVHHRQSSLAELSRRWPNPEWQLAINPGLPSASYLDANALFEPEEPRRSASLPPEPTDVHVAGASFSGATASRKKPRGGKPARDRSARDRSAPDRSAPAGSKGPGSAESPAPPRTAARQATEGGGASQTRPLPRGGDGAAASPAPAAQPPHQRRAAAPAARQAHGGAGSPVHETAGEPRGRPVRGHDGPPRPSPARATPTDPHGLPVMPARGRRDGAETASPDDTALDLPPIPPAPTRETPVPRRDESMPHQAAAPAPPRDRPPAGPGDRRPGPTAQTPRPAPHPPAGGGRQGSGTREVPAARHEPDGAAVTRENPGRPSPEAAVPAQRPPATAENPSPIVVMQKVLRPEHVHHYLEGGYDLVAGYVHRLGDVRELTTPAAVIRALGLIYEGSPFAPTDEQIHVIRWPAVKPPLFRRPLGGIDEWSMGIIPGGWVIEKAPFPGSGYAPGDGPAIPEFKIESQRLPHGAEMYRIAADGRETLVAGYDADLRRWLVRLPASRERRA